MGWLAFHAALIAIPAVASSRIGRRAAAAPALLVAAGAALAVFFGLLNLPEPRADWIAFAAKAGLSMLGFASAAQLRVSRLARQCPSSFRLTCGGAPLYFQYDNHLTARGHQLMASGLADHLIHQYLDAWCGKGSK